MAGTFAENIDKLIESVGHGSLKGSVEVNQIYAHYQHEHPEFKHPEGGKSYYLRDPLFENHDKYMRHLAEKAITAEGSSITDGMKDNMENLSRGVFDQAPLEFGDLKGSGHPKITSDGVTVYDRPPNVHRLSKEDLRAKGELRDLFGRGLAGRRKK